MGRSYRAGLLRFLFMRERLKASNEEGKLPTVLVLLPVGVSLPGHSGEADAILDDGMNLTIREILRRGLAQVRGAWIEVRADSCHPTAIDPMTRCAARQE